MKIPIKVGIERHGGVLAGSDNLPILEIEFWRWGLAIQLPRIMRYETFIDDPDRAGDLITRSALEARRAAAPLPDAAD